MNSAILKRLAALQAFADRQRLLQTEPLDPLSASLFAFEAELAALDEIGIAALAAETDERGKPILDIEQAQRMADNYRREAAERRISAFRLGG